MAYYNSLSSLGENTLQYDDIVELMGITYRVTTCHLRNENIIAYNDQIFAKLGIENKEAFCSNHYGYTVTRGAWPEYKNHDYLAATRLVKALFILIEHKKALASKESEESKEVAINKPLKEESKLSVLLPSKHRNIKQIEIQKEITLNKL